MPRTYGRLQAIKLPNGITKTYDEKFKVILRNGARAYIKELIVRVPVWTGMSRGSIKFARGPGGFLGAYLNVAIPIIPHPEARVTSSKNATVGGRFGSYDFRSSNHVYRFRFRSDVLQFILNEFYYSPTRPEFLDRPWHAQEFAAVAFRRSLDEQLAKLPRLRSYLIKVEIPFGR